MERAPIFERIDRVAAAGGDVFSLLRGLPIDVVADVLLGPPSQYPAARAALPRMAPDEVQVSWTGSHGHPLLLQSCAFVRALENGFLKYAQRPLEGARILDYGCGWGRLMRLMYKFTPPSNLYGCDPWDKSIELCKEAGVQAHLAVCDYLPRDVPFTGVKFDLIYAFSVFTHLSERTMYTVLAACRKAIADEGILACTIRPVTYWDLDIRAHEAVDCELMKSEHQRCGFAFTPHNLPPIDGEITYGDTSVSLDYIRKNWSDWLVVGVDCLLQDPYQSIVFLKPRV